MEPNIFQKAGKRVESIPVYLGTASFGTTTSEAQAFQVLDAYYELGGRHIDTANNYAFWNPGGEGGESEALLGRWLESRNCRDELVLSTKVGALPVSGNLGISVLEGLSKEAIKKGLTASLQRLRIDYVDIYLAHVDDQESPFTGVLEAFGELMQEGRILTFGASNYRIDRLIESFDLAQKKGLPWFSMLQQRYSLLRPLEDADLGMQELLSPEMLDDIRILFPDLVLTAYSPLLDGAFLGKESQSTLRYHSDLNKRIVLALTEEAAERGCHVHAVVLKRIYEKGLIPITMTSSVAHLRENIALLLS